MGLRVRDETGAVKPRQLTEKIMSAEKLDHLTQDTPHPASGHLLPSAEKGSQPPAQPEGFIEKPEVARRLNKTIRTVDNWMTRGILPYYKMGRSVSFRWSEVEAHLAQTCRVCRR